jgi:hypothetical protein
MSQFAMRMSPGAGIQGIAKNLSDLAKCLDPFGMLPNVKFGRDASCCEIPETECPPHCVCEFHWKAQQGSTVQANIQVTNTGSATRNFTFTATPFTGPGNVSSSIQLSPPSANLAPQQSVTVAASLVLTQDFQPGARYTSEVHIDGAYQPAVCVTLDVQPATCEQCNVQAGDPPVRIRAHHWYDHFQCEEPCLPAQDRKG